MKKALIFLSAFVVSFVIIYSVYYYSRPAQLRYLDHGFTAQADTLKHTLMRPHPYEPSATKNLVYSAGILHALQNGNIAVTAANAKEDSNIINNDFVVTYTGKYNEAALSKMNTELKNKFPNHPPLELKGISEGKDLLFAYVFRNAFFPEGFRESAEGMKFAGKNVKAITYNAAETNKNVQLFTSADKKSYVLKIVLENNEEAVWVFAPDMQDVVSGFKKAQNMIQEGILQPITTEEITVPVLDFYLVNEYTNQQLTDYFSPQKNDFGFIQERLKIKTSAEQVRNMFGRRKKDVKESPYKFSEHSFFYLKRKDATFPYFGIVLHNADMLIRQP